ncbi:MAG: hypothetical protein PVI66_13445, partial [Candidatus Aminicenantes bacterium]
MKHEESFNLMKFIAGFLLVFVLAFYPLKNGKAFSLDTPQKTKKVVAGEEYAASGIHKFFLGTNYRSLWLAS